MKVNYLQIKHLLTTTLAILLLSSSTANCMSKRETPEAKERGGAIDRIVHAGTHGTTINPKDVEIFNRYKDTKDINKKAQAIVEEILSDRGFSGFIKKTHEKVGPGRPAGIPHPKKGTSPKVQSPVTIQEEEAKTAKEIKQKTELTPPDIAGLNKKKPVPRVVVTTPVKNPIDNTLKTRIEERRKAIHELIVPNDQGQEGEWD